MYPVSRFRFCGMLLSVSFAGPVFAQENTPTLPAGFVVHYYLADRSVASSSPPFVLLCSDRLTPAAMAGMDSLYGRGGFARGIHLAAECEPPGDSGAVLLIHRFDLQPEARIGVLQATRFEPGRQLIRIEETYRTEDFFIRELRFTLSAVAPLIPPRGNPREGGMTAEIELLDVYRRAREYLMPEQPWLVVCDRAVSTEALNTYVIQHLAMRRTHAMLHERECQLPAAVQSDTTQTALMIDQVRLNLDGSREVRSRQINAQRVGYLNRWDERFILRADGSAEFLLDGFRLVPPHE